MFGSKKKRPPKDEAQKFLESVQDEPDAPDPCVPADEELLRLADENAEAHYDIINLIVLAVIVIFFGTALLALTNKQDFSNDNELTKDSFFSGNYLARVERDFNESIPLQDLLSNTKTFIKSCFGVGNTANYIDLNADADKDDPYSVDTSNDYTPITDSQSNDNDDDNDVEDVVVTEADTSSEDDGKNKKLTTITLKKTQTTTANSTDEEEVSTTTNNRSPGATTTTTVSHAATTTTRAAETTTPTETTTSAADEATSATTTTTTTAETTTTTTTAETTTTTAASSEEETLPPETEPAETEEQQAEE